MAHSDNNQVPMGDVPPNSYRRRDRIARAQLWLPFLAIGVLGLFWFGDWLLRGDVRYSPGALADVHATWDDRCAVCHTSAQPLSGNHWTSALGHDAHAADAQCQSCHAGPAHHANEKSDEVAGCTSCHREHKGRANDLKRVANEHCVRCHGNLSGHVKDGATTSFLNVSEFAVDHPEFRKINEKAKDPGRIAFNHKLHLADGLREQKGSHVPFKLADIPKEFRERYRLVGQDDGAAVKLDCAACHRTDNASGEAIRAAGDSMLPINYEQHCQACHPLTFAVKTPPAEQPKVRHRLQPDEVRTWLRGYFTDRLLSDKLPLLDQPVRPLPGKNPERDLQTKKVRYLLDAEVDAAERTLLGPNTCAKCHVDVAAQQRIAPAPIPQIWLEHARFDHTAHRAIACQNCHGNVEASRTQADVLLPGVQTCQMCHSPAGRSGAQVSGARHDCVECHRYHGGDQPWHGRGAATRQPPHGPMSDLQRSLGNAPP